MNRDTFGGFFTSWFRRNFSNPELLSLLVTIVLAIAALELFGDILKPILISVVLAYLLLGVVHWLKRWRIPHQLAVWLAFILFCGAIVFTLLAIIPAFWSQLSHFISGLPKLINHVSGFLADLKQRYPATLASLNIPEVTAAIKAHAVTIGKTALQYSWSGLSGLISVVLYFVLVPILTLMFMLDSGPITNWLSRFLPRNRGLLQKVWVAVNQQMANYIRARVIEVIIVGVLSTIAFFLFGLEYALLLGVVCGLSVIIPYVGAVLSTIPLVLIAYFQFGIDAHFLYLMLVYVIIGAFDAYLLVPYLFSESMNLHPVVIIISIVIFGGFWGFWGVFFAIPLASVLGIILDYWPRSSDSLKDIDDASK